MCRRHVAGAEGKGCQIGAQGGDDYQSARDTYLLEHRGLLMKRRAELKLMKGDSTQSQSFINSKGLVCVLRGAGRIRDRQ